MNAPSAIFIIDDMSRFLHLKRHCLCAIWGVNFIKQGKYIPLEVWALRADYERISQYTNSQINYQKLLKFGIIYGMIIVRRNLNIFCTGVHFIY